jgi:uncharacterized protein
MFPSLATARKIKNCYWHPSGNPPLCLAAFLYDREVIEWLLWLGADRNARSEKGYTPLFDAICNPYVDVLRCLIEAGLEVNVQNNFGNTALMHSVFQGGQIEKTRLLLEAGADKTLKDNKGMTARDYAVRDNHPNIVELLDSPSFV